MLDIVKKFDVGKEEKYEIFLNGETLPIGDISQGINILETNDWFKVATYNLDICEKIKKIAVRDLNKIKELSLLWKSFNDFRLYIEIHFLRNEDSLIFSEDIKATLKFGIYPNLNNWKHKYSFKEYQKEFLKHINKEKNLIFDYKPIQSALNFDLSITHIFSDLPLQSELRKYEVAIFECLQHTESIIENEFVKNSIQNSFYFPLHIKTSCEQYLLYFAQFLQDLGINATSNLKEEAGKVLFSVTPTNDVEALDKIREALAVYLKLPESPIVYDDSFAAMRLQQQIENLQHSQKMAVREIQVNEKLLLAQSDMIREKNITISQQQTVIENQNKIIEKVSSKSIMMDSAENKAEFEKVFDGLEFGESKELKEKLGIKFNPVTSIKSFSKKIIGDDDEITTLNLNEEI